jgi:CHAT domain-containing protein
MNTIELALSREGESIRICATDREKETLRSEKNKPVSFHKIDTLCSEILSILNRANKRGDVGDRFIKDLKKTGQELFDELMTQEVKKTLQTTSSPNLSLDIDDQLMHIPWELLFDGEKFLCRKFNVGRIIRTKRKIQGMQKRPPKESLKMLIIADPKDNLSAAYKEGIKIRDELVEWQTRLKVHLVSRKVDKEYATRNIRDFDILHYTGHAEYDETLPDKSGWVMQDGTWTSAEVKSIKGESPFPFLIFSNACHSGRTEKRYVGKEYEKEIYDLASTFLQCGVTHYIGTFLEVLDTPSATFAIEFYKSIGKDMPIGEAVRNAREQLIDHYGESNIIWASYMLYGDPAYKLPYEKSQAAPQTRTSSKVSYAVALLMIVIVLYFGVHMLKSPPVIPAGNDSIGTPPASENFKISFLHMVGLRDDEPESIRNNLAQGSRMYLYDKFQFYFKSNRDSYVYLLKSSSPGNAILISSQRSVHAGDVSNSEYVIQLDAHLLQPDESAALESIYVLASEEKLEDRQQLLWEIEKLDESLHIQQDNKTEPFDEETDYKLIASLEVQNGRIKSINKTSP